MKNIFTLLIILIGASVISAGDPTKEFEARKIVDDIKIDGMLNEPDWSLATVASGFIQTEPNPGTPASNDSEVIFLYDNNAVYIGARLWDDQPDKILTEFSLRDELGNADNFSVFFDPFKSGLNGFIFTVTASGVQIESIVTNDEEDPNWNAVWESAVSIDDNGWYVEMKIPYSALRFPAVNEQKWNIQFKREIRRYRETTYWSPVDPNVAGITQQAGIINGINEIKSPMRLSLTPYVSGYVNTTFDPEASNDKLSASTAYSAGLDLKYGLSDAFTLDMTLVPDFGQVISDKQVLNLTPFEVYFEENRQFFTEGTELFNKGDIFYSRRIGSKPLRYNAIYDELDEGDIIVKNKEVSQLYNATKITGRTKGGTGIGFFNAIVGKEKAIVRDKDGKERVIQTNPLTNYNALVVDQNLKNNSFVSLMNTNVTRFGDDYDANVTGGYFDLKTKNQKYHLAGNGIVTQKFYTDDTDRGYAWSLDLAKISGVWTYGIGHTTETENYDPNDMGFIFNPNKNIYYAEGAYNQYKPKNPKKQYVSYTFRTDYNRLHKPNAFNSLDLTVTNFSLYRSRLGVRYTFEAQPVGQHDYFEPRSSKFQEYLFIPSNYKLSGYASTDFRKPFALNTDVSYRYYNQTGRNTYAIDFGPRIRINDHFSIIGQSVVTYSTKEQGFAGYGDQASLMGERNRWIVENALTGRYIFNAVMGIDIRVRHYWDQVEFDRFGFLDNSGRISFLEDFTGLDAQGVPIYDQNVNIFNVDFQYNWRFAPGSDIIFVWKNQIFNSNKEFERNYLSNFGHLFGDYQQNNFSIRVLYYLDYLYLAPRKNAVKF